MHSKEKIAKIHELYFELLLYSSYSPDVAPGDFYLYANLKKRSQEREDLGPPLLVLGNILNGKIPTVLK